MLGEDREPDRGRDRQASLPDRLSADRARDLLRHDLGALAGRSREQDQELLAAPATGVVVDAEGAPKSLADTSQDLVSDVVSVGVVDLLEVVEVEEDDRELVALLLRRAQLVVEDLTEEAAVVEPGEGIGRGLVVEARVLEGYGGLSCDGL